MILIFFDIGSLIVSYVIAYLLRSWVLSLFFYPVSKALPFNIFVSRFYLLIPYFLVFIYEGLYSKRFDFWEETRRLWKSNIIATALIMIILYITRSFIVSRAIIIIAFLLNFIFLPVERNFIKRLLHYLQLWRKNIVLVCRQPVSERLMDLFRKNPILGYKPIISLNEINKDSLINIFKTQKVDGIIVNAEDFNQIQILELYEIAEGNIQDFFVIPALSQLQTSGVAIEQLESVLLMKFSYNLLKKESQTAKRLFDLIIASISLLISLPIILIIILLIKITSPGPIFFIQQRLGKGKKLFRCYKFRTMYLDADKRLEETLKTSIEQRAEWERYFKITNDPRVTALGKFLRRSSLDELPQLLNVIKGEMSLVGPRPYLPNEVKDIEKEIGIITKVKPGLTGLWQVSGRSQLTFEERLRLDEFYVKNWSIWTDIVILVKTIGALFKAEGAY